VAKHNLPIVFVNLLLEAEFDSPETICQVMPKEFLLILLEILELPRMKCRQRKKASAVPMSSAFLAAPTVGSLEKFSSHQADQGFPFHAYSSQHVQ